MRKRIVFLGSDGSGKSSLISYIKNKFENEGKKIEVVFMGWRDFRNPVLRFFSGIYNKRKKNSPDKEKLDRFRKRSWFFYFIYYSELWLRYFRVLFSRADFILIDRYFYDELVFTSGIKFKFFRLLTPKPDLCFILRASNEDLRKREIYFTKEKLENFYNALYRVENICKTIRVNSSKPIKKIYNEIFPVLIQ